MKKLRETFEVIRVPLRVAAIAALVMVAITATFITNENNSIQKGETSRSTLFGQHLFTHLQLLTLQADSGTNAIALDIISNHPNDQILGNQKFVDGIMKTMPNWHNVSLSPNDCIKLVSPVQGNEKALGYCLYSTETEWKDISLIVKANKVRILGPYVLAQGGNGFIMHRPVYLDSGKYWGLVSAVITTEQLLAPLKTAAFEDDMKFKIEISDADNKDPREVFSEIGSLTQFAVTQKYQIGENTFTITAAPKSTDYSSMANLQRRMGVASAAIVASSFLLNLLVRRQKNITKQLQEISKFAPSVLFQFSVLRDGKIDFEFISENCSSLFGFQPNEIVNDPEALHKLFREEDVQKALTRLSSAKSPGEVWSQRLGLKTPYKDVVWVQVEATYERIGGSKSNWNGVFLDATALTEKEIAYDLTTQAFDILDEGVVVFNSHLQVVRINRAMTKITGYENKYVVGRPMSEFISGLNPDDYMDTVNQALANKGVWRGQTFFRNNDGSVNRDFFTFSAVKNNSGDIVEIVAVLNSTQDVLVDQTTGLANRKLFEEYLTSALDSAKDANRKVALLHIGVHGIGAVNDTFGHIIGDRVLREIAGSLLPFTATGKCLGRLGDSEFGLYRELKNDLEDVDELAKSILEALTKPFVYDDVNVLLEVSVGISIFPEDAGSMQELRSHSDQAYKTTLASGGNRIGYFSSEYEEGAKVRSYLASYLTEALNDRALQFYYQPIIRISDRRLVKAEVLTRWFDGHLGEVSPARFIPIAEKSNLIHQLGTQLLENVLEVSETFRKKGKEIQLSVNVSPVEFMSEDFVRSRAALFEAHPEVDKKNIVFELTEGSLLANKALVEKRIKIFRDQGIGFAIDDFGTGYSSLSYLQELSVDFVKIDKSFVDRIETQEGLALCKSIVDLAHAIGLEVIAEGVESEPQFKLLEEIGCDFAQGYLFSKPVNKTAFLKMVK